MLIQCFWSSDGIRNKCLPRSEFGSRLDMFSKYAAFICFLLRFSCNLTTRYGLFCEPSEVVTLIGGVTFIE